MSPGVEAASVAVMKKVIQVSVPVIKQASRIGLTFVKGGVEAVILDQKLDIVRNDLSIPSSFSENQLKPFVSSLSSDMDIIKGQNDMLFLSNSISYFVKSHQKRTGLDRSISYALQHDISAVRQHLKKHRDLRFPGYLHHQCGSLAETVKELNIFYVSILDNGKVPSYDQDSARRELRQRFGADQRPSGYRAYVPYDLQLPILREMAAEKKKSWPVFKESFERLMGKKDHIDLEELNDHSHELLFILSEELIANEELEYRISEKLEKLPERQLLIQEM